MVVCVEWVNRNAIGWQHFSTPIATVNAYKGPNNHFFIHRYLGYASTGN